MLPNRDIDPLAIAGGKARVGVASGQNAQAGIGREHAVEANQMQERTRHQRGQAYSPAMDATTAMRPELPEYASAKFVRGPVYFGVMVILATEYNIIGHDHMSWRDRPLVVGPIGKCGTFRQ